MPPFSGVWELREDPYLYIFYPAPALSRRWQAMCRIPWKHEQLIVPMCVHPSLRLRPYTVEWELAQRN